MDNLYEMILKADAGDLQTQYDVAVYITFGDIREGVELDWGERAVKYFMSAAAYGNSNAMCYLGAVFNTGRGVKRDIENAVYWWKQSSYLLNQYAFRPLSSFDGKESDGTFGKKCVNYLIKGTFYA